MTAVTLCASDLRSSSRSSRSKRNPCSKLCNGEAFKPPPPLPCSNGESDHVWHYASIRNFDQRNEPPALFSGRAAATKTERFDPLFANRAIGEETLESGSSYDNSLWDLL